MLTHAPTPEDVLRWRKTAAEYRPHLSPNRKSADEIAAYLAARYPVIASEDPRLHNVVAQNILLNDFFVRKVPPGARLDTRVFLLCNEGPGRILYQDREAIYRGSPIIIGLETKSRFFLVEGSSALHDELTAFAGLDADDLENDYCVAEYIKCLGE